MSDARYALYLAPARDSALHRWGSAWLGRDAETGAALDPPTVPGWPVEDIARVTAAPRAYGLHATLKPPFRLRPGAHETALVAALACFAGERPAPPPVAVRLAALGDFLALVPDGEAGLLCDLAAACVAGFDDFRAPPGDIELARRRTAGFGAREAEHLRRWGYPYVFDTFRFHVTLSGALAPDERRRLAEALTSALAPVLAERLRAADLALFVQRNGAPFQLQQRFRFGR